MPCAAQRHSVAKAATPHHRSFRPLDIMDEDGMEKPPTSRDTVDEEAVLRATAIVRKYLTGYEKEMC